MGNIDNEMNSPTVPGFIRRGSRREGLREDEMPLLFLVRLVEVAWSHGAIARSEKRHIFDAARDEGIDHRHGLNEALDELLIYQPGRAFFDTCLALIKTQLSAMTVIERKQKAALLIDRCRRVAAAAGGNSPMDVGGYTSDEEREVLTRLISELNFRQHEAKEMSFNGFGNVRVPATRQISQR